MKATKAQKSLIAQMIQHGELAWVTPNHTTTVALLDRGWIETYTNDHGVQRFRVTESGKAVG